VDIGIFSRGNILEMGKKSSTSMEKPKATCPGILVPELTAKYRRLKRAENQVGRDGKAT